MKTITRIIVPTDFSQSAQNAFRYAIRLGDRLNIPITLVHAVIPQTEMMDVPVMTAHLTKERVDQAREVLKTLVETTLTQLDGDIENTPNIQIDVVVGFLPGALLEFEKDQEETTLMVMGAKGERGALTRIFGSTTTGVVAKAKCDVMVVPDDVTGQKQIKRAMYATDLSDSDPFEIWRAAKMMSLEDSILYVVHFYKRVDSDMENRMNEIKAFFAERSPAVKMYFLNLPGDALDDDLEDFVEDHDIDLLIMYQKHRSFFDRLFHRSRTKEMTFETDVPMLVLKEK